MTAFESEFQDSAEREVLRCLFFHGPTFDGDIPSKVARSALFERHLVARANGWNALTGLGFERCVACGLGDEKDRWANKRRAAAVNPVVLIEEAAGTKYWQMAKGKVRSGEPLYGAALIEPGTNKIIAIGEADTLPAAIASMHPATER